MNYACLVFCILFAAVPAVANPIKTVGTGIVNDGQTTVEFRTGFGSDDKSPTHDGRVQTRQLIDHGFNDWYALRLTALQDDRGSQGLEYEGTMIDNRVQLFERAQDGFDGGFRLTYFMRDGDKKPDIAEMRWINHIPFWNGYEFRHHIIVQRQVGPDSRSGILPELRWQITRPLTGQHRFGAEMFNEFGNLRDQHGFDSQLHDAGLVFTGPLFGGTRYQAGYRHGLSDAAPDHAFKFFIGYDF